MAKNCVDCVFCIRNKDFWRSFGSPLNCKWVYEESNLTVLEQEQAKKGNFSFIDEDKRRKEGWIKEYDEKKKQQDRLIDEAYDNGFFGKFAPEEGNMLKAIAKNKGAMSMMFGDAYPQRKEFGMDDIPEAPENDYLSCWHKQWNSSRDASVLPLLNKKCCHFFFPLSKKEHKSLEGCEKERKELNDKNKFWRGIWVGALVTFIISLLIFLLQYFTSNNIDKYMMSEEEAAIKAYEVTKDPVEWKKKQDEIAIKALEKKIPKTN